jgi:hypothetical protein
MAHPGSLLKPWALIPILTPPFTSWEISLEIKIKNSHFVFYSQNCPYPGIYLLGYGTLSSL